MSKNTDWIKRIKEAKNDDEIKKIIIDIMDDTIDTYNEIRRIIRGY